MHPFPPTCLNFSPGLILIFLLLPARLTAQKSIELVKFDLPPVIDGAVDEAIWESAEPVTEFIQREPHTGQPISVHTEVYVGYDENNLYNGFRCYTDPKEITSKELARDVSLGPDDRVQVMLDTYHDRRNAYWFQVGPRGSIGDAMVSENGASFNKAWDGLWTGKAKIHKKGWDAEFAIPFKTLRFSEGQESWGI